jgi:hypothetical protein
MKEYFDYDLPEEDTLAFQLTDAVRQTPEKQVIHDLNEYIASHQDRVQAAGTPREAEVEERCTDFARLLLSYLERGGTPPQHKSYSLAT